jgi:hypothetical protein
MTNDVRSPKEPPWDWSAWLSPIIALIAIAILFFVCVSLSFMAAIWLHPAAGLVVALIMMVVWVYVGPPPRSGFLVDLIMMQGMIAILGVFLSMVWMTIARFWK